MLAVWFKAADVFKYHAITTWSTESDMQQHLDVAVVDVADELRKRGVNTALVYIPKPFDSLSKFEQISKSANYTSTAIQPVGNEKRFVAQGFSLSEGTKATFIIEGSIDNTNFIELARFDANKDGDYSTTWASLMPYVRYKLLPEGECSYSPFLVDTAYDGMIRRRACMIAIEPSIDGDGNASTLYDELKRDYFEALNNPVADTDLNRDGQISEAEKTRTIVHKILR